MSKDGGPSSIGTVFNLLDDGTAFTVASPFIESPEGTNPRGGVTQASDGAIIGSTSFGGLNDAGTIYRIQNGVYTKLFDLVPNIHGSNIRTDILELNDGTFAVATSNGSNFNGGALLRFDLEGNMEVLFPFVGPSTGSGCSGSLAYDSEQGLIYGTCENGGALGFGTAFRYVPNSGIFSVIHNFEGDEGGSNPEGGLFFSENSILYGTAKFGGEFNQGIIFQINPFGNFFDKIYDLNNATSDGRFPRGRLIFTDSDLLLGTCSEGGSSGVGVIFSCTLDGVYSRLHSFSAPFDGSFPKSGLTEGDDGLYYGVAELGTSNGFGSVFRTDEAGNFEVVHIMEYTEDGSNPVGNLTLLDNGDLVGVGSSGGSNDFGTAFTVNTGGDLTKIHDFSLPTEGSIPCGVQTEGIEFYGVTESGGLFNDGTIFRVELSGQRTKIFDFDGSLHGQTPNAGLIEINDGLYYGTARFGGEFGAGTIFSLTESGEFELLHSFDGNVGGQFPFSGLLAHSDGNFYGTTLSGGNNGDGIIYRLTPAGVFEKLYDFFGFFDGSSSQGALVEGNDGLIYGVGSEGGNFNGGTLFQFNPESSFFNAVHQFQTSTDGSGPVGGLLLHSDGSFYGSTTDNGSLEGTLFRFGTTTGFEILHSFNPGIDGFSPQGGLVEDLDGVVYGFCNQGGDFNSGTVFKYSEGDGFEKIFDLSSANSPRPFGTPALFYPECLDNSECVPSNSCSVAFCDFGLCSEMAINPMFSTLNVGACQTGLNTYSMTINIDFDINPGGTLVVGGNEIDLDTQINSYLVVLEDLPSNGQIIDLNYEFLATGCSGTTGNLGTAPVECPPVATTFRVDVSNTEVGIEGMFVAGNFQGWNPSENAMTEIEPDLWEITIDVGIGEYEFNFFNGSNLFDGEFVVGNCANNGKRILLIDEIPQTFEFCWETCIEDCEFLGTDQDDAISFNLYPNPLNAGQELIVDIPRTDQIWNYFVVDLSGRMVRSGPLNSGNRIQTNGLNSGLYHVYFKSSTSYTRAQKFILQ
ncbi:MAG: choice-of-anchor tandem repeat GloVer-containing protein [Bacteroidota bacterium]